MSSESDGGGCTSGVPGIRFVKSVKVCDESGYHVHQQAGRVVIVQFEATNDAPATAPSTVDV